MRIDNVRKIAGKTIKAVGGYGGDGVIVLAFEDGDHIQFDAEAEYDGGARIDFDSREDDAQLWDAGVITKEEYDARQKARKQKEEDRERAEFERLKEKFG